MDNRNRKKPKADLRKYYSIFWEIGLIVVLLVFIGAMKLELRSNGSETNFTEEQEIVEIEEIERTEQEEKPPPPPRPPVPQEVPNDEIIEDDVLNIDAELNFDEPLDMPPPPQEEEEEEEDFFRIVEDMPEIIGGQQALNDCIEYPAKARRAGIEGTVSVEFIVNKQGEVEDATILRGVQGLNEEALRCIKAMDYRPGQQRGEPVRVKFVRPVVFRLK